MKKNFSKSSVKISSDYLNIPQMIDSNTNIAELKIPERYYPYAPADFVVVVGADAKHFILEVPFCHYLVSA